MEVLLVPHLHVFAHPSGARRDETNDLEVLGDVAEAEESADDLQEFRLRNGEFPEDDLPQKLSLEAARPGFRRDGQELQQTLARHSPRRRELVFTGAAILSASPLRRSNLHLPQRMSMVCKTAPT